MKVKGGTKRRERRRRKNKSGIAQKRGEVKEWEGERPTCRDREGIHKSTNITRWGVGAKLDRHARENVYNSKGASCRVPTEPYRSFSITLQNTCMSCVAVLVPP